MSYRDDEWKDDRSARSLGGTLFLSGVLMGIACMVVPLYHAMNHADGVYFSLGLTSVSIVCMAFGIVTMIAGRRATRLLLFETGKVSNLNVFITIMISIASMATAIAFRYYLESYGYEF
jgi:hypothetical protein